MHDRFGVSNERYVALWQDVRSVRGVGLGLPDYHAVLYKVRLMSEWIERR